MAWVRVGIDAVGYSLAECDTVEEADAFCLWLGRERERLVAGFQAEQEIETRLRAGLQAVKPVGRCT